MSVLHKIGEILSHDYMDFVWLGLFLAVFIYNFRKNQQRKGPASSQPAVMEDASTVHAPVHVMEHRSDDYRSPSGHVEVNPATGFTMVGGIAGVDTAGNTYGSSNNGT